VGDFGICHRKICNGQHLLPMGLSYEYGKFKANLYCPRCEECFFPADTCSLNCYCLPLFYVVVDSAAFTPAFPHLFLLTIPRFIPHPLPPQTSLIHYSENSSSQPSTLPVISEYPVVKLVPKVYGFKIFTGSFHTLKSVCDSMSEREDNPEKFRKKIEDLKSQVIQSVSDKTPQHINPSNSSSNFMNSIKNLFSLDKSGNVGITVSENEKK
jgi:hypothetical protein